MKSRHMLVIKGNFPANEDIKNDPKAPDIDLRAGIGFGVKELGGGEVERATKGLQVSGRVVKIRKTKIDDFDVPRF